MQKQSMSDVSLHLPFQMLAHMHIDLLRYTVIYSDINVIIIYIGRR